MDVRQILARRGLRCTVQRERVYAALMASKHHPTAEELHDLVRGALSDHSLSLATVYNALEAFTRAGIARRIAPTGGGSTAAFRYDADCSNHAHLVAADGTVRDLPDDLCRRTLASLPDELIREIESRLGVRVGRITVEFVDTRTDEPDAP